MSSGPNIRASQRTRPRIPNTTIDAKVDRALRERCDRTQETIGSVIEKALRVELGMEEEDK